MNPNNKALIAVMILLMLALAGVVYFEHRRTRQIETALATLTADRETLRRQVSDLTRHVTELLEIEATPLPVIQAPPPTASASAPAASKREESIPGVTKTAPKGWSKNGSKPGAYVVGVDRVQTLGGMPSAYVKSIEPSVDGFGGMMQTSSAAEFAGKRVRLSGWVKTEDANDGGGHLWLRVDGQERGTPLQFDNMNNRAVKGTTSWQQYSVVLDVPPESSALAYGFFVKGTGQMWVSGTKIEPVGPEVPSTNMLTNPAKPLPKAPTNLTFD